MIKLLFWVKVSIGVSLETC